jgi:prevent-host-death family protein
MKRIAAAKFKEQCLSILDRLEPEGVIITKHGKPVATLVPTKSASAALIGSMRGKIKIKGDILSTGVKWDAES